jgi:hypothetical protein
MVIRQFGAAYLACQTGEQSRQVVGLLDCFVDCIALEISHHYCRRRPRLLFRTIHTRLDHLATRSY